MLEMIDVYHEIHTKGFCLEQPVMLGTLGFPFVDKLCFDGALHHSSTIWVLLAMQYSLHPSYS